MSDLDVIVPEPVFVTIKGEQVEIKRIVVGQLTKVMRLSAPFYEEVKTIREQSVKDGTDFNLDVYGSVVRHGDAVVEVIGILTNKPTEWVEGLEIDELVSLFTALLEVNMDFFIQRLLPSLSGLAAKLYEPIPMPAQAGSTPSKS